MHPRVSAILASAGGEHSPLRPTELYNEGWMLRLLLDWAESNAGPDHPFHFLPEARWFSEALLPSQFLARKRGDELAESWTNADGVAGHFEIGGRGKGDLTLRASATQLVVVEAKMFSGLSSGTKRAEGFDQAARNVACIAEVVARSGRKPSDLKRLAFNVAAPNEQIRGDTFKQQVTRKSIAEKVKARVGAYGGQKDEWHERHFVPVLERIDLRVLSWEQLLEGLDPEYGQFYERCLDFNRPSK